MKVAAVLLSSLFALTSCSSVEEERSRGLFLNFEGSEGTEVSAEYAEQGYKWNHKTSCAYRIHGTAAGRSAGDKDLKVFNRIIKTQLNQAFKKYDEGQYGRSLQEEPASILTTHIEIASQQSRYINDGQADEAVGTDDANAATRKLSTAEAAGVVKRNLNWGGSYSYGQVIGNAVCNHCGYDNNDQRGRDLMQDTIAQLEFTESVLADILDSSMTFFTTDAVKEANCLEMSCNDGLWTGTEGCE